LSGKRRNIWVANGICSPKQYHGVEHEDLLAESLRQATVLEALDSDRIRLLGIIPNAPDSGFGDLSPAPDSGVGMRPVPAFARASCSPRWSRHT
jgi:hypothetical protein